MIKTLEIAIERLKSLPDERQAYAACVLEQIADNDSAPFQVPDDHRAAIFEGLEQAKRGEFVSDKDVTALLHTRWA